MRKVQDYEFIPFNALESDVFGFNLVVYHSFMFTDYSVGIAKYNCFDIKMKHTLTGLG